MYHLDIKYYDGSISNGLGMCKPRTVTEVPAIALGSAQNSLWFCPAPILRPYCLLSDVLSSDAVERLLYVDPLRCLAILQRGGVG